MLSSKYFSLSVGRLLRAYNIDFNWYRLAAWVNLVEQWPYRLSWIILYFEEHDDVTDDTTLQFIYEKSVDLLLLKVN